MEIQSILKNKKYSQKDTIITIKRIFQKEMKLIIIILASYCFLMFKIAFHELGHYIAGRIEGFEYLGIKIYYSEGIPIGGAMLHWIYEDSIFVNSAGFIAEFILIICLLFIKSNKIRRYLLSLEIGAFWYYFFNDSIFKKYGDWTHIYEKSELIYFLILFITILLTLIIILIEIRRRKKSEGKIENE